MSSPATTTTNNTATNMTRATTEAWYFTSGGYPDCLRKGQLPLRLSDDSNSSDSSTPNLGPRQALVRIKAAALNPVDIQTMNLSYWQAVALTGTLAAPFSTATTTATEAGTGTELSGSSNDGDRDDTGLLEKGIGADFAGVVEQVGSEVAATAVEDGGFRVGDALFGLLMSLTDGVLQRRTVVDLDGGACLSLKPPAWSWAQAASLGVAWTTAETAIHAVEEWMGPKGDDTDRQSKAKSPRSPKLAVLGGSSATGIYTIILAKRRGWQVVATCSGRNAAFVGGSQVGADTVIDYMKQDVVAALEGTKGKGDRSTGADAGDNNDDDNDNATAPPDAIIDCVGGTDAIGIAPRYVTIVGDKTSRAAFGGPAAYMTHPRMVLRQLAGRIGLVPSYDCIKVQLRRPWLDSAITVLSSHSSSFSSSSPSTPRSEDRIAIDSVFGFDDVPAAYARLNTGRARGKVIVNIDADDDQNGQK